MAKREYERTCKRDGTKWYVSEQARREVMPNALLRVGAGMSAAGARSSIFGGSKAMTNKLAIDQQVARVIERDSCPVCRSQSWDEKKVKI